MAKELSPDIIPDLDAFFVLASEPFPLPSSAQTAPPPLDPILPWVPHTIPTTPGAATLTPQSTATGSCLPQASWALPRPSPLHLPPPALRQLQRKSDWAGCHTVLYRLLRRRVVMWLQAFPKGWCLSTHCCDAFFPASSLLWPTPGAYLQSGSCSLSPLPSWNTFTQLLLEGLQTILFLFPFFGKKPFPWGPRVLISVIPNCSSGWLHLQPASPGKCCRFSCKGVFQHKKSNLAKPELEERIRKAEE